jgi:hypothetical protein
MLLEGRFSRFARTDESDQGSLRVAGDDDEHAAWNFGWPIMNRAAVPGDGLCRDIDILDAEIECP